MIFSRGRGLGLKLPINLVGAQPHGDGAPATLPPSPAPATGWAAGWGARANAVHQQLPPTAGEDAPHWMEHLLARCQAKGRQQGATTAAKPGAHVPDPAPGGNPRAELRSRPKKSVEPPSANGLRPVPSAKGKLESKSSNGLNSSQALATLKALRPPDAEGASHRPRACDSDVGKPLQACSDGVVKLRTRLRRVSNVESEGVGVPCAPPAPSVEGPPKSRANGRTRSIHTKTLRQTSAANAFPAQEVAAKEIPRNGSQPMVNAVREMPEAEAPQPIHHNRISSRRSAIATTLRQEHSSAKRLSASGGNSSEESESFSSSRGSVIGDAGGDGRRSPSPSPPPLRVVRVADAHVPLVTKDLSFLDNRPLGVDSSLPAFLRKRVQRPKPTEPEEEPEAVGGGEEEEKQPPAPAPQHPTNKTDVSRFTP